MIKPTAKELQKLHAKACLDYANATPLEKEIMKFDVWDDKEWRETTSFVPMEELGVSKRGYFFRIRPEKKLRPWKPEEVPVGVVVVSKDTPLARLVIVGVDREKAVLSVTEWDFKDILEDFTLEDGSPCGVVE